MKAVIAGTGDLISFLENTTQYVRVDLYTFLLNDGVTALRWSGANMPVLAKVANGDGTASSYVFNLGPVIQDEGVKSARGVSSSNVDVTILGGDGRHTVNGIDVLDFIENFGFDGATCRIDRAFAATWSDMAVAGPIGAYNRFVGQVGDIKEHGQTQSVITIDSPLAFLQTQFPAEVYGTSCLNTFGDSKCGVHLASLAKSGTITGTNPLGPLAQFTTSLTDADAYWTLGALTFTSGANDGLSRSIKSYLHASGALAVTSPFPTAPAEGDTFTITPGCLLSKAACQGWDTPPSGTPPALPYTQRFRAQPYIPPPTTGLPS